MIRTISLIAQSLIPEPFHNHYKLDFSFMEYIFTEIPKFSKDDIWCTYLCIWNAYVGLCVGMYVCICIFTYKYVCSYL